MQRNALPASVAAAFGSEVSPTWPPRGPSGNLRALSKLHSLPPSTHRMCFLLTRQPNHASCRCVLAALESFGGAPRVRARSGVHRAQQRALHFQRSGAEPQRARWKIFGIADLTGISRKKSPPHLVSLIKVEGLFSPYIVTHFDIVNSESLVQRYIQLFLHWTK